MLRTDNSNILFPLNSEIPAEFKIAKIEQRVFLSNGELKLWNGPVNEVYSPIWVNEGEKHSPIHLGSYPQMGSKDTLEVLDSAINAYDLGRGEWPTMKVKDRILQVESFLNEMKQKRDQIIVLLMLEIGKNRLDSENEFDRTVEYIADTIEAVKDLELEKKHCLT